MILFVAALFGFLLALAFPLWKQRSDPKLREAVEFHEIPRAMCENTATRHNHKKFIRPDCFDCANAMCNECDSGFTEDQVRAARVIARTTMDKQQAVCRLFNEEVVETLTDGEKLYEVVRP